jgi:DnaJ domain
MSVEFFFQEILLRWPILVGVLILLSILLLMSMIARQPPGKPQLYLLQGGIITAFVALMALVVTRELSWLFALVGGLLPVVIRVVQIVRGEPTSRRIRSRRRRSFSSNTYDEAKTGASSSHPKRRSRVKTRFLHMFLDESTGDMRGKVLKGKFAGNHLSELTLAQLQHLYGQYSQQDAESATLLMAYLDRTHGTANQGASDAGADEKTKKDASAGYTDQYAAKGNGMTRDEAYEILGLKGDADARTVTDAHRRLMQKLHPDRGGTNYLAAKINQAKDLLLES